MKTFDRSEPIAVFLYFMAAAGIAMFLTEPVILSLSLAGSVSFFLVRNGRRGMRSHAVYLIAFIVMTLINPLFSHRGATVLFVLNDNPVTLESLLYGAVSAGMVVSCLYWFRSFTQIMSSDKLLHLFAAVSPKTALLVSMVLRYIPLFAKQASRVNASQKARGLYRENNIIDSIRGGMRVFSVMVTWTLENGIVTADSMSARGYGTGRRTSFSRYRFTGSDAALLALTVILSAVVILAASGGDLEYSFYPVFRAGPRTAMTAAGYAAYALLAFLPTIIETGDMIKWRCLKSGI